MYRKTLSLCTAWLLACLAFAQTDSISLEALAGGIYYPDGIQGVNPLADGETYSQLSDDGGSIIVRSFRTGEQVGTLLNIAEADGPKLRRIGGYTLSPDEQRILILTNRRSIYRHSFTGEYYVYDVATRKLSRLSAGGPQQQPRFSPDGRKVAFAREGNLFIADLESGEETQVTTDGKRNEIINGLPDWVNEEEFSTACSFDWSADSRLLAWVRYDESKVPMYSMQMFSGSHPARLKPDDYPDTYDYKYPTAGLTNSTVSVHCFDTGTGSACRVAVPLEADGYIPRLAFTPQADKLAVVTLNRHQSAMDIYVVNPLTGQGGSVFHEESDKYLTEATYESLRFYDDKFALISGRTGYKHIYLYALDGKLLRTVTQGNYDVTALYGYDARKDAFYYGSRAESPLREAVYRADRKGRTEKLSTNEGENKAIFSASMKYFLNVWSSAQHVPVTTLCDEHGKTITTLVDNEPLRQAVEPVRGQVEFFRFTTSGGVELNGYMVKPRNFDASRKYPVVMYQYSGPGSREVKDAWDIGFYGGAVFESYLAQRGFIAAVVDGRGTGGRGIDFEQCTYMNLGLLESEDQVEAALYLGSLPYVDASRIAIWGWSFGGFNTLMSMSEGRGVFKAGVAVAAPTNWRFYDTIYTERYMRTPRENAKGYNRNPISRAKQLKGNLLLIHGTADDNVHYRNFVEYSEELVQAGKLFRQQVYTNRNHSIYGGNTRRQLFRTICSFLESELQPGR